MKKRWERQRIFTSWAVVLTFAASLAMQTFCAGASIALGREIEKSPQRTRRETLQDSPNGYRTPPPRYVGSIYCYACHEDLAGAFAETKMGKLFLEKPTNDLERKGCEGCHGPGSNHAESGGGIGVGGLIEFRIDRGQSIKTANQACLECHDEAFWHEIGRAHV